MSGIMKLKKIETEPINEEEEYKLDLQNESGS